MNVCVMHGWVTFNGGCLLNADIYFTFSRKGKGKKANKLQVTKKEKKYQI